MADEPYSYSGKLDYLCRLARDRRLTQAAIAVATVLVDHANKETGQCFPSVATIIARAGVPKTTTIRALRLLEEAGWIAADKRNGAVTHYTLTGAMHGTGSVGGTGAISGLKRGQTGSTHGTEAVPSTEPEQKEKQKQQGKTRSRATPRVTFDQWIKSVGEDESLIPDSHPVWRYAENAGIPDEFQDLAWVAFCRKYKHSTKRYSDWARVFQNAIEGDWLRLWRFDNATGQYSLTTAGMQLQQAIATHQQRIAA